MDSWQSGWAGLSAEADGLLAAGRSILTTGGYQGYLETQDFIRERTVSFLDATLSWVASYRMQLPRGVERVATQYCSDPLARKTSNTEASRMQQIQHCLVVVSCLRGELARLLADTDTAIRTAAERAFEHLQRTIDVNRAQRHAWNSAFAKGEVACEALGAVHLLGHHIWAFKADAPTQRTDLVLGSPMSNAEIDRVLRMGACLVLTEWKVVREPAEFSAKIGRATNQLNAYAGEVLHGVELHTVRYGVIVSEREFDLPAPIAFPGFEIRFIGIALDRGVPSRRDLKADRHIGDARRPRPRAKRPR